MLNAFVCLLCQKSCQHNRLKPKSGHSRLLCEVLYFKYRIICMKNFLSFFTNCMGKTMKAMYALIFVKTLQTTCSLVDSWKPAIWMILNFTAFKLWANSIIVNCKINSWSLYRHEEWSSLWPEMMLIFFPSLLKIPTQHIMNFTKQCKKWKAATTHCLKCMEDQVNIWSTCRSSLLTLLPAEVMETCGYVKCLWPALLTN